MCQSSTRGMQGDAGIFFTRRWQRGDASSALGCSSSTPKKAARTSPMCWAFDRQRAQNTPRGSAGTPLTLLPLRIFPFFVFVLISLPVRDGAPGRWAAPMVEGTLEATKAPLEAQGAPQAPKKAAPHQACSPATKIHQGCRAGAPQG